MTFRFCRFPGRRAGPGKTTTGVTTPQRNSPTWPGSVDLSSLTRTTQVNWNRPGGDISAYNPALQQWRTARQPGLSHPLTPQLLAHELGRQASMIGFVDAFWIVTLSFLVPAPLLLLFRRKPDAAGSGTPLSR